MSESIPLENIDIDLSGVNLTRPILGRQQIVCTIGDVVAERDEKRGLQLIVPLILDAPGTSTNGETVNPGFVVTDRLGLEPKGKRTQEMIQQQVGRLQAAAFGLTGVLEGKLRAAELSGRKVLVTFDVRADANDADKLYQDIKRYDAVK